MTENQTAVTPLNVYSTREWIMGMDWNKELVAKGETPLEPFGFTNDNLAIIVGPKGVLVYCSEGVGYAFDGLDDLYEILLNPDTSGTNSIAILPTRAMHRTIQQIVDNCPVKQVPVAEYVRKHNPRLEQNFREMLRQIEKIGLNPADYYKGGR